MTPKTQAGQSALPFVALQRIDDLCSRFEDAWKAGQRPVVEEYLAEATGKERPELLLELLLLECEYRRRQGEQPGPDEYLIRFPDLPDTVRAVFAPDLSPVPQTQPLDSRFADGSSCGLEEPAIRNPQSAIETVPGYELLARLGRGGMAVVYKAKQTGLNRLVAIKMMLDDLQAVPESLERFHIEAKAIARLDHPHIVKIHEVGEHRGTPFLVMEFCSGGSLDQQLSGNLLPAPEVAQLLKLLARAVHAAHQAQVIHRDLKPHNILLSPVQGACAPGSSLESSVTVVEGTGSPLSSWVPKLTDFGLAKLLDEDALTHTGLVMGTPSYMAPEQAMGKKDLGPAVDIYALGAILYEGLVGRPPFKAPTRSATLDQVIHEEPVPPRRLQPQIAKDLETICLKCLRKNPRDRYASALDLAEDLRRFLAGEPVRARPIPLIRQGLRWVRKHLVKATLAAATLAILLLLPWGLWLRARLQEATLKDQHRQETIKVAQREARLKAEQLKAEQALATTRHYHALLNWTREGNQARRPGWTWAGLERLKQAAQLDTPDRQAVDLRGEAATCLSGLDIRETRVLARGIVAHALAVSPDGRWLAAGEAKAQAWVFPCRVLLIDLWGERQKRVLSFQPIHWARQTKSFAQDGVVTACFGPKGRWLAVGARDGRIHLWDLDPEQPLLSSWQAHNGEVHQLLFSSDGQSLFSRSAKETTVKRWSVLEQKRPQGRLQVKRAIDPQHAPRFLARGPDGKSLACVLPGKIEFLNPEDLEPCRKPFICDTHRICFSPDGQFLAQVLSGSRIRLDSLEPGGTSPVFLDPLLQRAHEGSIDHLAFNATGSVLLSASLSGNERIVKLWETASGRLLATRTLGSTGLFGVAWTPDGRSLITAGDRRVVLHEVSNPQVQTFLALGPYTLHGFCLSADGRYLACAAASASPPGDGWVHISSWELASGKALGQTKMNLPGSDEREQPALAFHPNQKSFVTAWLGADVQCWDLQCNPMTTGLPAQAVRELHFARDGQSLWVVSQQEWDTLEKWDWTERKKVKSWDNWLTGHVLRGQSSLKSVVVGKRWVLVGAGDGSGYLLDADTAQQQQVLSGPGGPVRSVALSQDERLAALGSQNGVVRLVSIPDGEIVADLKGHTQSVQAFGFSRDGRLLASGSRDGSIRLWVRRGSYQHWLTLHPSHRPVKSLFLTPDGNKLAVLYHNETGIRLWHLERLRQALAEMGLALEAQPEAR
jgi:serine/threonine protein kinase/WD40 repeat protein